MVEWEKLAKQHGFQSAYQMLLSFRRVSLTSEEIAAKLGGVSYSTVRVKMKELSIPTLPVGPRKKIKQLRKKRDFTEYVRKFNRRNERDLFHYLYWTLNMNPRKMGEALRCPAQTVQSRLVALGITRRRKGNPSSGINPESRKAVAVE